MLTTNLLGRDAYLNLPRVGNEGTKGMEWGEIVVVESRDDTLHITLRYEDGSLATYQAFELYVASGDDDDDDDDEEDD